MFRRKKKALLATWDDSDCSSSKEEQVEERANLCLLVYEDSEDEVCSNDFSDFTFDELLEAFHELMHDSTLLTKKLNDMKIIHKDLNDKLNIAHTNAEVLKSKNSVLTSKLHELSKSNYDHVKLDNDKLIAEIFELELCVSNLHAKNNELNIKNDEMTCKISALTRENRNLRLEIDKYKPIVEKFTYSFEKLGMILNSQQTVFDHAGLGYNPNNNQKCVNNFLKKSASVESRISTCYCCGKTYHKSYECNLRKNHRVTNLESKVKQVWVPKRTKVKNLGLSKKSWIPKVT